ncbi:hypothetical protein TNCV_3422271 [Trichonephila clavipes]|nr:hypothetical protein TNCV_3422271 [Trichonephila clavipes]
MLSPSFVMRMTTAPRRGRQNLNRLNVHWLQRVLSGSRAKELMNSKSIEIENPPIRAVWKLREGVAGCYSSLRVPSPLPMEVSGVVNKHAQSLSLSVL